MFHVEHFDEQIIKSVLCDGLDALKININESAIDKLISYFVLLLIKNEFVNLISPKQDLHTKIIVHLVDSLTPLMWRSLPQESIKAMDFGSGGGLPAIPLSIVRPEWNYTLIESTGKKALFLEEVQSILSLDNVEVYNNFLEPGKNHEKSYYNLITARGVSDMEKLFSIAGPRLKGDGFFISFKGPQGEREIKDSVNEMKKRKMALCDRIDFKLPFLEADRSLFIFQRNLI
ncbi:16S rRNA (guanine(527)-N(7))-methyltransferase RsmG [Deltaproteobacteria bacterium Smac51]|nr:16S rRNA (guanine(527)-N(7))-methyltransferase RsmG [Deltaproteobacteria bacterium Smac51]